MKQRERERERVETSKTRACEGWRKKEKERDKWRKNEI
jgi:hypothetical protein